MQIAIINGPNLNLLGKREPRIYGSRSFEDFLDGLRATYPEIRIDFFQSNSEGEIIDYIQTAGFSGMTDGIVINPGAYAHYSHAIADALRAIPVKAVEVHISNIHAREEFRSRSVTAPACSGVITGLGLDGYRLALEWLKGAMTGDKTEDDEGGA